MIITFIGHSSLPTGHDLFEKIRSVLLEYIPKYDKTSFYCGGYGEFDALCAAVCREIKPLFPNSEIVIVTPYLNQEEKMRYCLAETLYDAVLYPPMENVPLKYAIPKRNEWMVSKADFTA